MLTLIEGLPADVFGVEAAGKVTHHDYQAVLVPAAEARLGQGPIRMLYLLRSDLTDFAIEALWDEPEFGVKHWHDFSRIAIVSDHRLIRSATALFTPFFPAKVKIFGLAELETAKQWICADA